MCEGNGTLPECVAKWHPYGERLKAERIHRRMTLRAAAKHLDMDASNLSKMERGIIAPRDLWQNAERSGPAAQDSANTTT